MTIMKNNRGVLYWLRVVACILAIVLMSFRVLSRFTVYADSEVSDSVTLSYEQSLALFGTTIEGTYYSQSLNLDIPCYAIYSGRSSDYVPSDHWGSFYAYSYANWSYNGISGSSISNFPISDIADRDYLIYRICSTSYGTNWPSWSPSYTSGHYNFSCQFPFDVSGVSSLDFSLLFTSGEVPGYIVTTNQCYLNFHSSESFVNNFIPIGQARYSSRVWSTLTTVYKQVFFGGIQGNPPLTAADVPESCRVAVSMFPVSLSYSDNSFSVSGFDLGLNGLGAITNNEYTGFPGLDNLYCPLLFVQCPTLTGYTPPVVTTVNTTRAPTGGQPGTAVTGQSLQTVDLSNLESGVAAIVQQEQYNGDMLQWIGTNEMYAVNNLAYIADTLDKIYAQMVNSGQIAVNLIPADPLQTLSPGVHSQIAGALAAAEGMYTTAVLPNEYLPAAAVSFYSELYNRFTSGPLAFFGWLGILSLMLYVVCWFIFRGRG